MGFSEMLLISLLAFLLFGPKKTSELARQLGQHVAHFKRAAADLQSQVTQSLDLPPEALGSENLDGLRQTITGVLASGLTVPPSDAAYDANARTGVSTPMASVPTEAPRPGLVDQQQQTIVGDIVNKSTLSLNNETGGNENLALAVLKPPQMSENTYA